MAGDDMEQYLELIRRILEEGEAKATELVQVLSLFLAIK